MKGWRYRQPYRITDDDLGRNYKVVETGETVIIVGWDNDMVEIASDRSRKRELRRVLVEARINSGAWERA